MPTYRGISISLQSQYDARAIPEYPPLSVTATPSPRKDDSHGSTKTYTPSSPRTAETYIPIYPGSQLWINYECPHPEDTSSPNMKFFYFKLFVQGRCLLSWGIGAEDSWSGRTTYGIFGGEMDFEGRRILEKRAFFFPSEAEAEKEADSFEIRVFRSKERKRENARYENCDEGATRGAFKWNNAGRIKKSEPRRMFAYALIDPADQPYAIFKYNCRTVTQLERLGFDLEGSGERHTVPATSPPRKSSASTNMGGSPPAPAVPKDDLSAARRLSFPPSLHLAPIRSRQESHSPIKKHSDQVGAGSLRVSSAPDIMNEKKPEDTGKQRSVSLSEVPLPTKLEEPERGPTPPPHVLPVFSSNAGSLRGFANRFKRRSNSREEKGIFGAF